VVPNVVCLSKSSVHVFPPSVATHTDARSRGPGARRRYNHVNMSTTGDTFSTERGPAFNTMQAMLQIFKGLDDGGLMGVFSVIWGVVHSVLSQDSTLQRRIVTPNECLNNVKRTGEAKFCRMLKAAIEKDDTYQDLLNNGNVRSLSTTPQIITSL
jgi:hypothetical protein